MEGGHNRPPFFYFMRTGASRTGVMGCRKQTFFSKKTKKNCQLKNFLYLCSQLKM
jgi:hypothetical protein